MEISNKMLIYSLKEEVPHITKFLIQAKFKSLKTCVNLSLDLCLFNQQII